MKLKLTQRQRRITYLLSEYGLGNKEIADDLGIAESTVKLHIMNITRKVEKELGVKHINRTQVALFFAKCLDKEKKKR